MMLIRMLLKDKFLIMSLISIPFFIWIGWDVESKLAMTCMFVGVAVHMNIIWYRVKIIYHIVRVEINRKKLEKRFEMEEKIFDDLVNDLINDPKN